MLVEFRNWIAKNSHVNIDVVEITGETGIAAIDTLMAGNSQTW